MKILRAKNRSFAHVTQRELPVEAAPSATAVLAARFVIFPNLLYFRDWRNRAQIGCAGR